MTAPADAWVPVPLRWKHVQPGDVIVGRDGRPWSVGAVGPAIGRPGQRFAVTYHGTACWEGHVGADATVQVLTPVPERDAAAVLRDELAGQLVARRTAREGAA